MVGGLLSRASFYSFARPVGRIEAWRQWELEVTWYGFGLFLFCTHWFRWGLTRPPNQELRGCVVALLWWALAAVGFILTAIALLPDD